ncbi:ferredoxin [Saccharopolyspora mangrovi]|uniref:Ferredoxin n=1 Tax=Saccharopolyspora mangrovi TaxID=3082379 RepID=A0ABU6AIT4_9PSEU|nr:ferredoxin [Saccharopolyspora sp. S2-29]MEB3371341.1 ferredoxin [Saccharopolyspora sp. S2-29]
MKVTVDRAKCTGLGICESMAPDVFEVDENGDLVLLTETVGTDQLDEARAAVEGCPTEALRLVEE